MGQILPFGPRLGWRRKLRKRRYQVPEADRELGAGPFGDHYRVGQQMLEDPWIVWAVSALESRPPVEPLEEPAKPARKGKKKEAGPAPA
jgi:hypothetical protein